MKKSFFFFSGQWKVCLIICKLLIILISQRVNESTLLHLFSPETAFFNRNGLFETVLVRPIDEWFKFWTVLVKTMDDIFNVYESHFLLIYVANFGKWRQNYFKHDHPFICLLTSSLSSFFINCCKFLQIRETIPTDCT